MVEIASLALDDRAGMTQKDMWLNVFLAFLMIIINSWCIHSLVLIIIIMSMFIAPVCVRLLTLLHHSQLVWHWRICQLRWEQYPKSSNESPNIGGRLLISAISRPDASKRWGLLENNTTLLNASLNASHYFYFNFCLSLMNAVKKIFFLILEKGVGPLRGCE